MTIPTTSWLWAAENGTHGLTIANETPHLRWYDALGCLCGDDEHYLEQTIEAYRRKGPPWGIVPPPPDIVTELDETLQRLTGE